MNTTRKTTTFRLASALVAFAVLAVSAFVPAGLRAQAVATGTVTGRVLNQGTGEYLRNATVTVVGSDLTAVAEAGGNYRLLNVPAGPVKLAVKYAGLETVEVPVVVAAGQTITQDVTLTSADYSNVVKLGDFVVATEREGNAKAIMEQKNSIEAKRVR